MAVWQRFTGAAILVAARYPNTTVRASGWLRGDELMQGKAAVVAIDQGPGKIVLFGIFSPRTAPKPTLLCLYCSMPCTGRRKEM